MESGNPNGDTAGDMLIAIGFIIVIVAVAIVLATLRNVSGGGIGTW